MRPLLIALAAALGGCMGTDSHTGPSTDVRAVTGLWAGSITVPGGVLFMGLNLYANHDYQTELKAAGETLERERGTWTAAGGRVYFSPTQCDRADDIGGALRPVTCIEVHDIAINVRGDEWPIHFDAGGEVLTITLRRL